MDSMVPRDRPLADLLSRASSHDLEVLADLITDHGKGRVALDSGVKAIIVKRRNDGTLRTIADVLEAELRAFAGNSLVNLVRSSPVGYDELARDVAKKLGLKPAEGADVFAVEQLIVEEMKRRYASEHAAAQPPGQAPASLDVNHIIRELVAAAGTVAMAGTAGASTIAGIVATRGVAALAPPFAAATAGTLAYQALGTAYRITVPAVLQIAEIRRKQFEADLAEYQKELLACL